MIIGTHLVSAIIIIIILDSSNQSLLICLSPLLEVAERPRLIPLNVFLPITLLTQQLLHIFLQLHQDHQVSQ
jgi:hypothetical protein